MSAAAAREPSGTIPYGLSPGGGGAGGKFRKNSYRRPHAATPYDRPPSSIRNLPGSVSDLDRGSFTRNDGWLRRIVNPAQRFLTASAHNLFASIFQKRLTQPPHPPENDQDAQKTQQEDVTTRPAREPQGPISVVQKMTSTNDDSSFVNLEKILKQRTFSKSEIDRLTALLHTRPLDSSVANEVKRPEVFSSGPHDLNDGTSCIMQKDDGNENLLPITHVKVVESEIASPAELAKAYMGTRASKAGPSGFREDSLLMTSSQQTPKLPVMSLIPTSSNHRVHENGFITPRSQGRSAVYSMARTPYARVHQTTPLKILEPMSESERGHGRSVAPQAPETRRISGSNALKRRSSIFENDIGSVGPLRRIRHKPNLSYPRNNILLSSNSVARHMAPLSSTDSSHKFTDQSVCNEGIAVPSRNVPSGSSKSREIASRILEQLDKIVSPPKEKSSVVRLEILRDKAPMKLFPSDLHGKALKSLDHIDSSKYLEIARGSIKVDDSAGPSHQDPGASAVQQIDKVKRNGPLRAPFGFDELPSSGNHQEASTVERHAVLNDKVVVVDETIPVSASRASVNQTFRMSTHQNYADLDDDDQHNKANKVDDGDKLESTTIKPMLTTEAHTKDVSVPVSEAHIPPFGLNERNTGETPFTAIPSEKTLTFGFPCIPQTKKNVEPDVQASPLKPASYSSTSKREPNVVPAVFTFGKEANSGYGERPAASAFVFVNNGPMTKDADKFNGSPTTNFASQSSFSQISSSFSATASGPVTATATATELNKVDDKKDQSPGVPETPTPAPLAASTTSSTPTFFTFDIPTGPAAAQPGFSLAAESSASPVWPVSNLLSVALSGSGGSDGKSTPQSASAFAHQAPPIFNFGLTTATSTFSETPAVAPVEVQNKGDSGLVNTVGNPFSSSSSANSSTVSSIFGFTAPTSNGASSDKQGPISFGVSNGFSQALASTSGLGLSSSTQMVPFQFGSSAPSFSFGLAGNTNTSSGSSPFYSSAAVKFSTGTSLGITSSPSSESTVVSSSSSSTSNLFGYLQTTAAPVFGTSPSSISPSTGFSYGALSLTGPISFGANAASSSGSIFGSFGAPASSNGPSRLALSGSSTSSSVTPLFGSVASTSSPALAFTFSAPTAGSHPIFGNSTSVFSFGQTSTTNNDQMNAEDSMAEDTKPTSTPPVSIFGQQQISLAPPSNSVFSSGANPFQFGGQQSFATPPNPSPFAASGSFDFNASGGSSFSLGTGGGDKSARKIVKVKHRQRRK